MGVGRTIPGAQILAAEKERRYDEVVRTFGDLPFRERSDSLCVSYVMALLHLGRECEAAEFVGTCDKPSQRLKAFGNLANARVAWANILTGSKADAAAAARQAVALLEAELTDPSPPALIWMVVQLHLVAGSAEKAIEHASRFGAPDRLARLLQALRHAANFDAETCLVVAEALHRSHPGEVSLIEYILTKGPGNLSENALRTHLDTYAIRELDAREGMVVYRLALAGAGYGYSFELVSAAFRHAFRAWVRIRAQPLPHNDPVRLEQILAMAMATSDLKKIVELCRESALPEKGLRNLAVKRAELLASIVSDTYQDDVEKLYEQLASAMVPPSDLPFRHDALNVLIPITKPLQSSGERISSIDFLVLARRAVEMARAKCIPVNVIPMPPRLSTDPVPGDVALIAYHTVAPPDGKPGYGLHCKNTYFFDRLSADPLGYSGWSHLARRPRLARDTRPPQDVIDSCYRWIRRRYVDSGQSNIRQLSDTAGSIPTEQYIFLPLQIPRDSVQAFAKFPMLEMAAETVRWSQRANETVVIKRHPACRDPDVADFLETMRNCRHVSVSTASVHDLIKGARVVVVVNSSVGFEALLQLKPVICIGESEYIAVSKFVETVSALNEALQARTSFASDDDIKYFLYRYLYEYCVDPYNGDDVTAKLEKRIFRPLRRRLGP